MGASTICVIVTDNDSRIAYPFRNAKKPISASTYRCGMKKPVQNYVKFIDSGLEL